MGDRPQGMFGEWGNLLVEQLGVVSEALFAKRGGAAANPAPAAAAASSAVEPVLPPLSLSEWVGFMDQNGRFSEENAKEFKRYAFYGVSFILFPSSVLMFLTSCCSL